MTRDRDYERPDDWFAAQFDDDDAGAAVDDAVVEGTDDPGADDAAREWPGADDGAREFTWGLRPSGDVTSAVVSPVELEPPVDGLASGSAPDLPSMDEVLSAPSPRRAAKEAAAREVAAQQAAAREAAAQQAAAREDAPREDAPRQVEPRQVEPRQVEPQEFGSREVDPRRFIERTGGAPSGAADHRRIAATPVSPAAVPPAALLTPEASGLESLFGTSGDDMTGPVLIPRKRRAEGTATSGVTRAAPAARTGAREKRGFTSNQVLIASIALLAVLLAVIVVFALVRAETQDVSPDVDSVQVGTLIPGIGGR